MKSHQSTQTKPKSWPTYIRHVNIFTNQSVVLQFCGEDANGKATYHVPTPSGTIYSNIPHSVATATEVVFDE